MNQNTPVETISRDTQEGHELSGRTKTVTSYRTWLFSGGWPRFPDWPSKNVHTNVKFAQNCGLPERNASGAMLLAYLSEMLINLFGERWLSEGRLKLKFTRPVSIDDMIIPKVRVISKDQEYDILQFDMEVWCENQDGHKVAFGTATGWIH